jgi:hypothetical protein
VKQTKYLLKKVLEDDTKNQNSGSGLEGLEEALTELSEIKLDMILMNWFLTLFSMFFTDI